MDDKKKQMESLNQLVPVRAVAPQGLKTPTGDLVHVYISFEPDADVKTIESYTWNVTGIDHKYNLMVAWVDVNNLRPLASLSDVRNIKTVMPPVVNVVTEGDAILRSADLRSLYGVTGAGMKIGVISDGVDHLSDSIAKGELPGDVHVLNNTVGGDEGTAMLEIVHDIAPDAELYFHDCGNDMLSFNRAIDALINNGTTVVIDDIVWLDEPFFEDGIIASNISEQVNNRNIVYVTAAGNEAQGHYQGMFYDDGTGHADLSQGTSSYKTIYYDIPAGREILVILEWNDTWGASANDYDFYLKNATTGVILARSESYQGGTGYYPFEGFIYINPNSTSIRVALDVYNYDAQPSMLEIMTIYGGDYAESYNTNKSDSIFGHAAASSVIAAGAIWASDPGNDDIAYYSSQGPVTIYSPYSPSYEVRSKPDVCGIDGVSISGAGGFGSWSGSKPYFYGTSAAAPHVGAIAALVWSAYPGASADDIRNWLRGSSVDLGTPAYDGVFGYGRADALNMFSLPNGTVTGYVNITGTSVPISNVNVNLVNASDTSQVFASTTTNSSGIYVFNNIPSLGDLPKYKLTTTKAGFNDNYTAAFGILPDITNRVNASMVNNVPLPVIQLNATAYTVDENGGTLYVNVTKTNDYDGIVGVTLNTIPGTATSPTDYTAVTTQVTFTSGQMSSLIPVTINDDGLFGQTAKQFSVQLSDPTGAASLGTNHSAIITIAENDPAPTISLESSDKSVYENESLLSVNITRENDSTNQVSVYWSTSGGNASYNYTASSGTAAFNQGEFMKTIQVPIIDDHLYSSAPAATFFINISSPAGGATLKAPTGMTVFINEADPAPTVKLNTTALTIPENAGPVVINVTRANDSWDDVTVDYTTADGSAASGVNYGDTSGTLVFHKGEMGKLITIPIIQDHLYSGSVDFTFSLDNLNIVSGPAINQTATITITNVDPAPVLQVNQSRYDINENAGTVTINVTRANDAANDVTVHYSTSGGNATPGVQYVSKSGDLIFHRGQMYNSTAIQVLDDGILAMDSTFDVVLSDASSSPPGASIGTTGTSTVYIHDSDTQPALHFDGDHLDTPEAPGTVSIDVIRDNNPYTPLTVQFETLNGTAVSGLNFVANNSTLTFGPGVTRQTIVVTTLGSDGIYSNINKQFHVHLENAVNATITGPDMTVSLIESDPVPIFQFNASAYSVSESEGMAILNVTRTNDALMNVTVNYTTVDGTAKHGVNYVTTTGMLTFQKGEMSQQINVPLIQAGENVSFNVSLSAPGNGSTIGTPGQARVNINAVTASPTPVSPTPDITCTSAVLIPLLSVGAMAAGTYTMKKRGKKQ